MVNKDKTLTVADLMTMDMPITVYRGDLPVIDLKCSSMDHVIDRAKAFLFCDLPYKVVAVRPDGFVLSRADSVGIKSDTLYVKLTGRI